MVMPARLSASLAATIDSAARPSATVSTNKALGGEHDANKHDQRDSRDNTSNGTTQPAPGQNEPHGDYQNAERDHAGQQDVPVENRRYGEVEQRHYQADQYSSRRGSARGLGALFG